MKLNYRSLILNICNVVISVNSLWILPYFAFSFLIPKLNLTSPMLDSMGQEYYIASLGGGMVCVLFLGFGVVLAALSVSYFMNPNLFHNFLKERFESDPPQPDTNKNFNPVDWR